MDAQGPDVIWPIPNGKVLKENHLGKNIMNYDSMLVLAHFKGHPMGGYGGALKQLSIGCASRAGKALIHSAGKTNDRYETWKQHASSVEFPEAMADAAASVVEHFKGRTAFINVMIMVLPVPFIFAVALFLTFRLDRMAGCILLAVLASVL